MQVLLPRLVVGIVLALRQAGFEAYVVGGSVRDFLLDRPGSDWDFTTNAHPEQIQSIFPGSFYENQFGTVGVSTEHLLSLWNLTLHESESMTEVFEITTYRSEGQYQDFRRPSEVQWGTTLLEDLKRRDFTMNALALEVLSAPQDIAEIASWEPSLTVDAKIIDPYGGQADLAQHLLRSVGPASERFQEDALRMLRAVRLSAQLHLRMDQDVVIALQSLSANIQHVSWERIRDEFLKILSTEHVENALGLLHTTKILPIILPELEATRGVDQRGHHEYDVWKHSLLACQYCPTTDPIVKFAALLHDIAKPQTQAPLENAPGQYSFFNHEVVGARVAKDVAKRFCLSKEDVQRVFILVRWHMFYYQSDMTDAAIRRFIVRVGKDNIDDIVALREGDRLGSGSKRTSWRLEEMKDRVHEQLNQPMQINEMVVDGTDVMTILNVPPGRIIGEVLSTLFEQVLDQPELNTREYLLPQIEAYKAKLPTYQAPSEV